MARKEKKLCCKKSFVKEKIYADVYKYHQWDS